MCGQCNDFLLLHSLPTCHFGHTAPVPITLGWKTCKPRWTVTSDGHRLEDRSDLVT